MVSFTASAIDFKALSVYDVWEQSPFRTGALTLTPQLTPNPLVDARNPSENVVGAQRSRFGSNRFGLRVDLADKDMFELTPEVKYAHVKLLRPVDGRVMLVGLGSRNDVADQNPFTEQFWTISTSDALPGQWADAVFPIKGAGGITVRSLVVVPHCESPHRLTEDFLFYVDDIEVNNDPEPRIAIEYYPFEGSLTDQTADRLPLTAKPGDTLETPVFIDLDRNGRFTADEMTATIPAGTATGLYRIRRIDSENRAVDRMVNVIGETATINDRQLNGEIIAADGRKLSGIEVASLLPFRVKLAPEKGFHASCLTMRFGYGDLDGGRFDRYGNPQWFETELEADSEGYAVIPADYVSGSILLMGKMVQNEN